MDEIFNYFIIIGLLFFLFFILIVIFGYIFFNLISKKVLKIKNDYPIIFKIFLSFAIGTTIYLSFAFILLGLNTFNFYSAYLPLVAIDVLFCLLLLFKSYKTGNLKPYFNEKLKNIRQKKKMIIIIFILLTILIYLQLNLQLPIILKSTALQYKDPYSNLKNIYYMLDTETIQEIPIYPPGFTAFCSGALLISEGYLVPFYFLKLGSLYLLFLFIIYLFFLLFYLFKSFYIAFFSTILFFSYYFYLYQIFAFLYCSVAVFFLVCL